MTWTAPKTWAEDEVLTASDLNTYLRDNMNNLRATRTANWQWYRGTLAGQPYNPGVSNVGEEFTVNKRETATKLHVIGHVHVGPRPGNIARMLLKVDGVQYEVFSFYVNPGNDRMFQGQVQIAGIASGLRTLRMAIDVDSDLARVKIMTAVVMETD